MTKVLFDSKDRLEHVEGRMAEWAESEGIPVLGMLPTALEDLQAQASQFAMSADDRVIHAASGMELPLFCREWLKARPHCQVQTASDLQEAAFGTSPSLKARSALLKTELNGDVDAFKRLAAQWGADLHTLKPGVRPILSVDGRSAPKPDPKVPSNNPFVNLRKADGTIDPLYLGKVQSLLSSIGAQATARIAAAAGKDLTGLPLRTRPF